MKVALFGRNAAVAEPLIREVGMTIVEQKPEAVVCIGGDGTLMEAEFNYPGIPKVLLRDSMVCKKCSILPNEKVLERISDGRYREETLMKLQVEALGISMVGINDIVIHNADARHAIRYRLQVDERPLGNIIIGDGIVVSTPFGSTGYYRSITDSTFEIGVGLAFNNSTEQQDHIVLKRESIVKLVVDRGPVIIYADNQQKAISAGPSDEITIKAIDAAAVLWTPEVKE